MENLTDEQFDDKVGRLLKAKFEMGLFENPYVSLEEAQATVGTQENYDLVKRAAAEALTLVKYENVSPLSGRKIVVAGSLAEDANAPSRGWKIEPHAGNSILAGLQAEAGAENVAYIGDDVSKIAETCDADTTVVVVIGEASGTHEPAWGTSTLEFPDEQADLIAALGESEAQVVAVVLMNRPYVMTDVVNACDAVLLAYRPGMTAGAEAVAEALLGLAPISGATPFQIPASMDQVLLQREDAAKDITDPLFDYGFGIEVASFGE